MNRIAGIILVCIVLGGLVYYTESSAPKSTQTIPQASSDDADFKSLKIQ